MKKNWHFNCFFCKNNLYLYFFTLKTFIMKIIIFSILLIVSLYTKAATMNSRASGNWNAAASWTVTSGTDADGLPDADDDVTILNGHIISLNVTTSFCKSMIIDIGGQLRGNNKRLGVRGNFTNNGSVTSTLQLFMQLVGATFSSLNPYTAGGDWYIQRSCTIAAGTIINKRNVINIQNSGTQVVNFGSVTLNNSSATALNGQISCSSSNKWINKTGSSLTLNANTTGLTAANFLCSEATNTVTYAGTNPVPLNTTYYNLNVLATTTKTLTGNLSILNNFFMNGSLVSTGTPAKLSIGGDLTANGPITLNNPGDTIVFNGTSAITQSVTGTGQGTFYNLKINNTGGSGVRFNTNQTITNDLVMVSGNCNSNSRLTLRSDINASARIAPITNTASVSFSGNMHIQKFIGDMPGQYYDLSSPTQNSSVSDWDNEIFISGIGTYDGIGGPAGVDGDVFNGVGSMHTYDEPTNSFVQVTGSATPLVPGTGYQLLLADDASATSWLAKTIDNRGIPNFGNISLTGLTYNAADGAGWHLVGNPYASHIDYALVTKLRMTNNIYFTDNGNYSDYVANFGTVLAPFQGFYVETNTISQPHSITFTESCKVNNHTTEFYRKKNISDIKLIMHSSLVPYSHENTINFNQAATVNYDESYDASYRKFPVPIAPAIYMVDKTINKKLIRNVIDSKSDEVSIPLGVFTPKAGVYYLDVVVSNADSYTSLWIENTKTGNRYEVGSTVAVVGEELGTNTDFVLKMSKKTKAHNALMAYALQNDVIVFATENTLNLKSLSGSNVLKTVEMYDMTGKLVFSGQNINITANDITKLDITALSNGIYIVNTVDENGKVLNKKVVK
jgi:hypothetical protein